MIASTALFLALTTASCSGSSSPGTITPPEETKPPASVGHALVFDEARRKVLMLNAGLGSMDDSREVGKPTRIWEWDGSVWRLIDSSGPPIRNLAGVAYDTRRNVIVVHGGTASATLNYGETWEWSSSGWAKKSDGGPGVRSHTQMAFDKARGRAVLFGGQNADATVFPNDTWEWDGTTWTRAATSGTSPRVHHAMGYDPASGHVILFGGYQPNVTDLGDAWAWDGTKWTQLTGSTPRTHAQLGITPTGSAPLVVGGITPGGPARTMLVFEQNAWRSVSMDGPPTRYLTAVAYDATRRVLVMYGGGATEGTALYADTWEFDGTTWQRRAQ
jgi:hypothetical protein